MDNLRQFVREAVSDKVSLIGADDNRAYTAMDRELGHAFVRHADGEYVVGAVHTNTIEGFWSLVKRGMVGTFHKVSRKYLPLYVAEFQFRYARMHTLDHARCARCANAAVIPDDGEHACKFPAEAGTGTRMAVREETRTPVDSLQKQGKPSRSPQRGLELLQQIHLVFHPDR